MNAENVIKINQTIDQIHSYFPILAAFGVLFMLQSYLPVKQKFNSKFNKVFNYFKVSLISLFAFIFLFQGVFGGCVIHLGQNFLAQKYLNRNWANYGLVYREKVPKVYWPLLRTTYLGIGLFASFRGLKFYEKRILFKSIVSQNLEQNQVETLEVVS